MVGLLFASHPIHTEAVSNIVSSCELLCCLFYIISLLLFILLLKYLININKKINYFKIFLYIFFITIFFYLSVLSKEIGITLLGIMIICIFCYILVYSNIIKNKKLYTFILLFIIII